MLEKGCVLLFIFLQSAVWQLLNEPSHMEIDELSVFFHLLDLAILNRYILLSSCGEKHKRFLINRHAK
jgi:hypothetical protein